MEVDGEAPGRHTHFTEFEATDTYAHGVVAQTDNGIGVDGPVLVTLRPLDLDDPEPESVKTVQARNGLCRLEIQGHPDRSRVQAHYIGQGRLMPCESKEISV